MATSFAQLQQDIHVLQTFKSAGYYVDIGAYDGKHFSNTFLLEKNGWKGICIEAHPCVFKQLKNTRKKAICVKSAVYSETGKQFTFADAGMLSGIMDHAETYAKELENKKKFTVTTRTLTSILDEKKAPSYIEYLSIDTEGSELEVLKGIDFEKYKFGYITIEHNYEEPRRRNMRNLLICKGYVYLKENKWDDDYSSPEIAASLK